MNRITGNVIRKDIKPFNKFNTLQGISSLEKKIIKLSDNKKNQFAQTLNYLNIVLRSRYSGVKMDKNIRYFDNKQEQGNFPITTEGVKLALNSIVEDICDDEVTAILNICTHNHAFLDSVTSYTKTAKIFMKCINMEPDYTELNHIKEVLDSNLKVKFKDKRFYEILFLCADNNLDNINLESTDLSGLNMKNISLKNASLKNIKLIGTILKGAILQDTNLENAILENANIEGAFFKKVNLRNSNLKKIKGFNVTFDNTDLAGCNMEYAKLFKASFIKKSILENAFMQHAKLRSAKFTESSLIYADLRHANLKEIYMYKCDMSYADFTGNKFYSSFLSHSDFSNAQMENTQFEGSKFGGSSFNKAKLTEGVFKNCDLNGIDLSNAYLQKSEFLFDDLTGLIGINQIKICGTDFKDAKFKNILFNLWLPTEKAELDSWVSNNNTKKLLKAIYSIESPHLKSSTISNDSISTTYSYKESSSNKLRFEATKQLIYWINHIKRKNPPMFDLISNDLDDFILDNEMIKLDYEKLKFQRTASF